MGMRSNKPFEKMREWETPTHHEHDCEYVCVGCDRKFCDIKSEQGIEHEDELPDAYYTDHEKYCFIDCFTDSRG